MISHLYGSGLESVGANSVWIRNFLKRDISLERDFFSHFFASL